ncbi:hypothetical protein [Sphaerisporangium dianthi]|uniref:Uncharacterized protein n=1 Tax=Sphaerisporangium dianthi TaxID=1436120 RepID=A0ABV9CE74_9ACTN
MKILMPRSYHVSDAEGWQALLDAVDGFRDGVIQSSLSLSTGYVDRDLNQVAPNGWTSWFLLQFQHERPSTALLRMNDVSRICVNDALDVWPAEAAFGEPSRFEILNVDIVCGSIDAMLLDDSWLGPFDLDRLKKVILACERMADNEGGGD